MWNITNATETKGSSMSHPLLPSWTHVSPEDRLYPYIQALETLIAEAEKQKGDALTSSEIVECTRVFDTFLHQVRQDLNSKALSGLQSVAVRNNGHR